MIIWSKIDPQKAKEELETLLSAQQSDGFIPHIIKWPSKKTSHLTQPPIIALALEEVYKNTKDDRFMKKNLPKVEKYFSWLEKERSTRSGLLFIIHPWESTDASPTLVKATNPITGYWELYRDLYFERFRKVDILFNCLYAQGLRCLARLSNNKSYNLKADKTEKTILTLPYDGTLSSLLPIVLENVPQTKIHEITNRLKNPKEFNLPHPVPFVAKNNPAFDPDYHGLLWRGPTWINTNWLLVKGLLKHGETNIAKKIAKGSIELIDKQGCWEFYNPLTGKGEGQQNYSWSALVLNMLDFF